MNNIVLLENANKVTYPFLAGGFLAFFAFLTVGWVTTGRDADLSKSNTASGGLYEGEAGRH